MKSVLSLLCALVLILALTACAGTNTSSATSTQTPSFSAKPILTSHEDFVAAELGTTVTVEAFIQAKQAWHEGKASFYTQTEDGAYFIYEMACTQEEYDALTIGTGLHITGKKSVWSGELEITEATFTTFEYSFVADPRDVTNQVGSDDLIDYQNERVSFRGMTIVAQTGADGQPAAFLYQWDGKGTQGDDLYFKAAVNDQILTFTVESSLCGADTDVYKAVEALKVGDVVDLEGFLYWYDGPNPHVTALTHAA